MIGSSFHIAFLGFFADCTNCRDNRISLFDCAVTLHDFLKFIMFFDECVDFLGNVFVSAETPKNADLRSRNSLDVLLMKKHGVTLLQHCLVQLMHRNLWEQVQSEEKIQCPVLSKN